MEAGAHRIPASTHIFIPKLRTSPSTPTHTQTQTPTGVLDLLRVMDEALRSIMVHVEVVLPYSEASTLSQVTYLPTYLPTCLSSSKLHICTGDNPRTDRTRTDNPTPQRTTTH